jgi:hypothetical protein
MELVFHYGYISIEIYRDVGYYLSVLLYSTVREQLSEFY